MKFQAIADAVRLGRDVQIFESVNLYGCEIGDQEQNRHLGEGALVGAGSVVTRRVPPHTIVAGNPARVLRRVPGR